MAKAERPSYVIVNSYTIIALAYCASFAYIFNSVVKIPSLATVHALAFLTVLINYIILRIWKNFLLATHIILLTGTTVVLALFSNGGWDGTGYLWPFAYLPFAFFLADRWVSRFWVAMLYFGSIVVATLQVTGVISHPYSNAALFNYFAALTIFIVLMFLFAGARNKFEDIADQRSLELEEANRQLLLEAEEQMEAQIRLKSQYQQTEQQTQLLEDTKRAILNILEDLSEEKARVEEEKVRDEALITSIGEGLIVIDQDGDVSNVNPVALELLGQKEEDLVGKWFPKALKATDEKGKEVPTLKLPVTQALATGLPVSGQVFYKKTDGTTLPAFVTVSPVLVGDTPVGAVQVFRDITRELELERAKEDFVSLASHQLRTPATGVKAFTSMLLDGYAGELQPKQLEFLHNIQDSNERQLRIVDDMLNVARVDSGRMVLEKSEFNMVELIQSIVDEQAETIKGRQQTLKLNLPKSPVQMIADPAKLRMAIENFVSNASKYTKEKGSLSVTLAATPGGCTVTVADSGVGIAKKDQGKLFKRFSRIDNELATKVGGTGLGLYLTKKIIDMHGGKIAVESTEGKGTKFVVDIPSGSLAKGKATPASKQTSEK